MDLSSAFQIAGATWCLLMFVYHIGALVLALVQPILQGLRKVRRSQPPISVLIPVKQFEPDIEKSLVSVYTQAYPRFEVLICSDGDSEKMLDAMQSIAQRFPQITTRFVTAGEQVALNPKVNNLAPAIEMAAFDLLLIKDSNIELKPAQFAELIQNLTPGVGLVCAIPIAAEPQGFAAEIEQAFMNGHDATSVLAASTLGLNIGYGKVMLFNRRDFEHSGGVSAISNSFGDDHALSKALARISLRTVYTQSEVTQSLSRRTLTEMWNRQLRWMVIRRDEEFAAFFGEPFLSGFFAVLTGIVGASYFSITWWLAAAGVIAAWILPEMLVLAIRGWRYSWRYPLAAICRDIMIWTLWLPAWFARSVHWAGNSHGILDDKYEKRRISNPRT